MNCSGRLWKMPKLLHIIRKNLLRTYRSKRFVAVSVISPIILILVIGFVFTTQSMSNVKIGIVGDEKTLSGSRINIVSYSSDDSCVDGIKQGDIQACVIVPYSASAIDITIYTDFSKFTLSNFLIAIITEEISKNKENAEINVLKAALSSAQEMKKSIMETSVKLEALKSGLKKSQEDLEIASKKQKSFDNIKPKIEENQRQLNDVSSSLSSADSDVSKLITTLNGKKREVDQELADCTQLSFAVNLDFVSKDCRKARIDTEQYKFLLAVRCSNYTSVIEQIPFMQECNMINIESTLLTQKIGILKDQQSEIGNSIISFQSMQNTIQNSRSSITSLSGTLESIKSIDTGFDVKTDELSEAIKGLEASEKSLNSNIGFAPVSIGNESLSITARSIISTKTDQQFLNLIAFVLLITFSTVLVSSSLLMNEKSSPAFIRNFISPTNEMVFFLGIFINNFIIAILQASIFTSFLVINGTYIPVNMPDLLFCLFLIETMLVLIGMMLALMFEKRETAIIGTVTILIMLIMLSGILIPIERMSGYAYLIGKFSPIAIIMEISRKVILFNLSVANVIPELTYLAAFSVVMFFAVWFVNKQKMRF